MYSSPRTIRPHAEGGNPRPRAPTPPNDPVIRQKEAPHPPVEHARTLGRQMIWPRMLPPFASAPGLLPYEHATAAELFPMRRLRRISGMRFVAPPRVGQLTGRRSPWVIPACRQRTHLCVPPLMAPPFVRGPNDPVSLALGATGAQRAPQRDVRMSNGTGTWRLLEDLFPRFVKVRRAR